MKIVLYGSPVANRCDWLGAELGPDFDIVPLAYDAADAEKTRALAGARALIGVRFDLDQPSDLGLVQVPGVGCDEIDTDLLPGGAALCNVRGHDDGVAEFVMLQMLQWCHRADAASADFRTGSWARSSRFGAPPHRELAGSVAGIVGYGGIGRALAHRLRAFGVRVLVANRRAVDADGVEHFPLDRVAPMFAQCDFGILCIGLAPETQGLIGAAELAALGPEGVLVNVARGPVVQEDALWAALTDGSLGGAILDVWYRYPESQAEGVTPSRHAIHQLPNVLPTPHMAGWTAETVARRWSDIVENIRRLEAGKPLINIVAQARK